MLILNVGLITLGVFLIVFGLIILHSNYVLYKNVIVHEDYFGQLRHIEPTVNEKMELETEAGSIMFVGDTDINVEIGTRVFISTDRIGRKFVRFENSHPRSKYPIINFTIND